MAPPARSRLSQQTPRQSRGPVTLPAYEPLAHPLNQESQFALRNLPNNHKLDPLKQRLKKANELLTEVAGDINDRLHDTVQSHEKQKKRREQQSSQESGGADEEALENMRQETAKMTETLDEKVRSVVDARVEVDSVERALKELDTNVASNQGVLAPTQSTLGASQFRGTKRRRIREDDAGDEEDDSTPVEVGSALETFKNKIEEKKEQYQLLSLAERYASNNDYIGFRQTVHDARNPGESAPPLPHASTWFGSQGADTQQSSFGGVAGTQADEDDEDLVIQTERLTTKCPITLRIMKDPVKSTKCVHNFEKEAIHEMISMSEIWSGGNRRYGQRAIKCPQCEIVSCYQNRNSAMVCFADADDSCLLLMISNQTRPCFARSNGLKLQRDGSTRTLTRKMMVMKDRDQLRMERRSPAPLFRPSLPLSARE